MTAQFQLDNDASAPAMAAVLAYLALEHVCLLSDGREVYGEKLKEAEQHLLAILLHRPLFASKFTARVEQVRIGEQVFKHVTFAGDLGDVLDAARAIARNRFAIQWRRGLDISEGLRGAS